ncbi:pyridoxal-phosphate dependent enzyme [Halobaculum sp. D14]|uniref:pyridoxal-phosphate dependent enzyme n=1 Tax=Halobaculum sp. D14 TaxID=3421642 RepID=UPI003EBFE4D8
MSGPAQYEVSAVGDTPLVELDLGVAPTVYGKVEWLNFPDAPLGGTVKSRIAVSMLDRAERRGDLDGDATVIEPSSGNTGSAVARVAAARGYDAEIVARSDVGAGKVAAIRDAGATVRFVDPSLPYFAKISRTRELCDRHGERYYFPNQYVNPANPAAHERTGREIVAQTDGDVTAAVLGVGTGGTATGVARVLPDGTRAVGFEPAAVHGIEGLRHRPGAHGEPTEAFERALLDDEYTVSGDDAHDWGRRLRDRYADEDPRIHRTGRHDEAAVRDRLRVDGDFLVGESSGAAAALTARLAERGELDADDVVVILLADRGDRYPETMWRDAVDADEQFGDENSDD